MGFLKNLRVKVKLISAFLIVAFLISVVGVVGIVSLKNVGSNAGKMYKAKSQSCICINRYE
jgi:methyl-accepting chemotaxis protein